MCVGNVDGHAIGFWGQRARGRSTALHCPRHRLAERLPNAPPKSRYPASVDRALGIINISRTGASSHPRWHKEEVGDVGVLLQHRLVMQQHAVELEEGDEHRVPKLGSPKTPLNLES
jgi:hypothetical protein